MTVMAPTPVAAPRTKLRLSSIDFLPCLMNCNQSRCPS
jgi:hypothetical protein